MTSTPSKPQERIRLTISVTPEVHATFQRIAKSMNTSIGRAMGEWLGDTGDAATHVAGLLERAKETPRLVAQELHAYALGAADETGAFLKAVRERATAGHAAQRQAPAAAIPPSSLTGGKSHRSTGPRGAKS